VPAGEAAVAKLQPDLAVFGEEASGVASVRDELAIALPHPNVLNLASSMMPVSGFTFTCSFITSPHSGAPTMPVPTFGSLLSIEPTLRGLL